MASIIFRTCKRIQEKIESPQETPFTMRLKEEYYDDFLESSYYHQTLIPIITLVEILICKYDFFHSENPSTNFFDFTANEITIKNINTNPIISHVFTIIEKIVKNIDENKMEKLYKNMQSLFIILSKNYENLGYKL